VQAVRQRAEQGSGEPLAPLTARLRQQFLLTKGQTAVLEQVAEALANERQQLQRLAALVGVGQESSVIVAEQELLQRVVQHTREAFRLDTLHIGILQNGALRFVADEQGEERSVVLSPSLYSVLEAGQAVEAVKGGMPQLVLPLSVKGQLIGALSVTRAHGAFADRDRWLLRSLASQISTGIENARLYHQLDGLFRQYMAPSVATALIVDPAQAELGGALEEVSVLFADLQGYTAFSEHARPEAVVAMLNRYFGAAAPAVLAEGGTIDKFVGDALMALFNVPVRQPDHALRVARAALAMQRATDSLAAQHANWPRFRIGIHSGSALVGNIGSAELRNYTAIGDTVNSAARLQASAKTGQIVISAATYAQIREFALAEPLAPLQLKGKSSPLAAYLLLGLREAADEGHPSA
jgi:class 3 adenylate cyclase